MFFFNTDVCILDDAIILRFRFNGRLSYMVCTASNLSDPLIQQLFNDAGNTITLIGLEDSQAAAIASTYGSTHTVSVTPDRNQYNYIYLRSNLASVTGGKLKAKRNHVNRFRIEHPDYIYRPLSPDLFDECRRLQSLWREERGDSNPIYGDTISAEQHVIDTMFNNWDYLGMIGGSIFVDGKMVAFSFGAPLTTDTFDVCVEKADRNIEGAFAIINQQFAAHLPDEFIYINREEDMGISGLRKAKLSYHPEILLSYNVVSIIKNDA